MISLIAPAYQEEAVARTAYGRMRDALALLPYEYEMIFVDDGSRDDTMSVLREIAREDEHVKVLSFSRNFGHQLAVTAGMDAAKGDALVIIDMDLQDPPEVILQMVEAWEDGADIVYGKRIRREGETLFKKLTAHCYYRVLDKLSAYPIPPDTGDFRLLDRKVAEHFLSMREHDRFLRGMSAWMGYVAVPVEYVRAPRAAGETKYSFKKMLNLAVDGILGFSDAPLLWPFWMGCGVCALSFAGFVALLICALTCGAAGWLWAFCALVLLGGLILVGMGVMGAYIARILHEAKGRPLYIVKEKINIGG
ncbi:MAG: glycosyltransferase family 2 protein [Clostridia bacterium]|nr:glycosyltransferase family 2 protein [Clostridia bacterium]